MSDIFAGDFPQEYLERAIRIAELDREIAESAQRTAESAQRTAELQAEISAEFRKMAETIRERRSANSALVDR